MIRSTPEYDTECGRVTCLFLDIGGVLLTKRVGSFCRLRASTHFSLDLAEMEDRHHLTFDTYEEGKLTLKIMVGSGSTRERPSTVPELSPLHVRAIETLPGDDRGDRSS